ncbi:MAG: aldehyde dehydrogenase [Chloroflexi bacterium]|nr:aldehyde dehydrogenase [Chloroflexota bacterium]
MPHGWAGTNLEIDLSQGTIEKVPGDPEIIAGYLGGKGTNARLMWERVPPEVGAFSPENLLIVGAGLLTGTMVPGANQTCITYKSPVTDLHCYSNMGGFFAAELKHAGYDTIVFSGKSETPVYLWVDDDHVELRDARHLWGKSTFETQRMLRQELQADSAQVLCIGLAGENRVYHASVEHGPGASASRGGTGCVMGDKKLKAIAVRGRKDVTVAQPERLFDLAQRILDRSAGNRTRIIEHPAGAYVRFGLRWADFRNFSGVVWPALQEEIQAMGRKAREYMFKTRTREVACANCAMRCKHEYQTPEGDNIFLKCALYYPMVATQILDVDFVRRFVSLCQKYGMDYKAVGHGIAFATDLYQRGILTREDTDGLELKWESPETAFALAEKMARREGIGDILADGTYRAARKIGRGAENHAFHIKKMDLPRFRIYHRHHLALIAAMTDKACLTKLEGETFSHIYPESPEEKETYIREGWFGYPKEFEKYLLTSLDTNRNPDLESLCQFKAYDMEQFSLADSAGECAWWLQFLAYPPINRAMLADCIAYVTGLPIDEAEATRIARRIINLVRAYNVREGIRRQDDFDAVPKHAFERTPPPPEVPLDPATFNRIIDRFYEIRGWDREGIPTAETLAESGLEYVRQDLAQRGILKDTASPVG